MRKRICHCTAWRFEVHVFKISYVSLLFPTWTLLLIFSLFSVIDKLLEDANYDHRLFGYSDFIYINNQTSFHKIFFSFQVTEREVINGILNVKNTKNHCLAYIRYINNINLQNLKKASLFVDIINRSLDTESVKLLANLRDERLPAKIETSNIQK